MNARYTNAVTAAAPPAISAARQTGRFAAIVVATYVFLLFSRMPEIMASLFGTSFYQIFLISGVLGAIVALSGRLSQTTHTSVGLFLVALHVWILIATPFSQWRGGTFEALTQLVRFLPMFWFVGALLTTERDLRKSYAAVALAVVVVLAWASKGGSADDGRLALEEGRFKNANEIAMYYSMCLPFVVYILGSKHYARIVRLAAFGAVVVALVQVLRTGSRGGLITLVVLASMIFFASRAATKLKMLLFMAFMTVVATVAIPSVVWKRFATLFEENAGDTTGAVASAQSRKALLLESIKITLQNPIVGVGPGVYAAAAADLSRQSGLRPMWQVTHNAYTQISAEAGIPALIFYLGLLVAIGRTAYRVRRRALARSETELAAMAGCLLLSLSAYCINGLFASIGTDFYTYMLAGFAVVLARIGGLLQYGVPAAPLIATATPGANRAPATPAHIRMPAGTRRSLP